MERAAEQGIPCKEADLTAEDLEAADELFLTSSIRGLMGVSRLEDREFEPGTITRILHDVWEASTRVIADH
jgi:branched-subunit amino acid aminotransferase/4-amino-4-deoxychorismate lyase